MKVIKRDGRAVDYDPKKIKIAIGKANEEVIEKEQASKEEIDGIIHFIEFLGKKRMLVEDIQDIIEQKLMEIGKYDLAKKYIVYRYTRGLVRKANTTDESILGLIRKENDELKEESSVTNLASTQRECIAREVSRDLTKRLLLPEKITKADQEGLLHFHNADYFIQPIINSSYINFKYLLENGLEINGYKINPSSNFKEACQMLLDIIFEVANNQYGIQKIDISCLGTYLQDAKKEDLEDSLRFIKQHLNTTIINGRFAHVKFLINLNENDVCFNTNKQLLDIMNKVELSNNKTIFVETIDKEYDQEKFDQGKVSINLVQAAIVANGNKEVFYTELKNRLELCKEALMCKHYALLGTASDISPILWQNGGIANLNKGEKIDSLLKDGISTLSLGYIGEEECANLIDSEDNIKEQIIKIMLDYTKKWTKETGVKFILDKQTSKEISSKFLKIDKEKFGTIKNITDKEYYEINRGD